jgi:hypothetical protein
MTMCSQQPVKVNADLWGIRRSCAELEAAVRGIATNPHVDPGHAAVALEEAAELAFGIGRMLRLAVAEIRHDCPACNGRRVLVDDIICDVCKGTGKET